MSRFILRSNVDVSDQNEKPKVISGTPKTPTKKGESKKNRKTSHDKLSITSSSTKSIEEEDKEKTHISIICSLPLSRLTGVIEKLSLKTTNKSLRDVPSVCNSYCSKLSLNSNGSDRIEDDEGNEEEKRIQDSYDDDTTNTTSKSQDPTLAVKTLCLYCDKKFSTHKMQLKHIEKFHTSQKDRRCSVRNSQVLTTSPRSKSSTGQIEKSFASSRAQNFPGCLYCKQKVRTFENTSENSVKDFNGLFLHLTEHHADKYFGCKICVMRFQTIEKLMKHMHHVHKTIPDAQLKLSKEYNDTSDDINTESTTTTFIASEKVSRSKQRHGMEHSHSHSPSNSVLDQSVVIGAEEQILSRLGLTQNRRRMPSNRKGVRLRRDTTFSDMLLKNDSTVPVTTTSTNLLSSPSKVRSRNAAKSTNAPGDSDAVIFRVPARTDSMSATFDDNFYKEVSLNVRNNLLFHLDGKLDQQNRPNDPQVPSDGRRKFQSAGHFKSNVEENVALIENVSQQDLEIHVATNLTSTTAFPTLLTAEQYCGDAATAKIRRPHTKHSWKWKWDSVKKYKLINEGGKIVKKAKHPMLGLRDLSKLDMWTQLTMRQKHEKQLTLLQNLSSLDMLAGGEKRRLNDQLNAILDMRVLPHIILEQSEQAIIKVENDEFNFCSTYDQHDESDDFYAGNILGHTFADESFLSRLQLLPRNESRKRENKLVLSGEWARPRCYLCMCCGNKFEKLKSLEEHKMFRHSNILSTHYEVVGRELLAGNLLQHLFMPKRALCNYGALNSANKGTDQVSSTSNKLIKYKRINMSAEEESSDSIQSISNIYTPRRTYSLKNTTSTTDDCDTDTKTSLLGDMNTNVSPSHSLQSSFSSSLATTSTVSQNLQKGQVKETDINIDRKWKCSKCTRKCNSMLDLYRHMLDCSGDYVWSMAKKRKYRYYCGSKKRRPTHRQQHLPESRKSKQQKSPKSQSSENCTAEENSSNSFKTKTPPRPRPSDAESIKKMLENLPAKRVCKKIFPIVNKVKKTKKPTFISKLYNTKVLRKTRARQLAHAVKRTRGAHFVSKVHTKNKVLRNLQCRTKREPENSITNTAKSIEPATEIESSKNSPQLVKVDGSPKKQSIGKVSNIDQVSKTSFQPGTKSDCAKSIPGQSESSLELQPENAAARTDSIITLNSNDSKKPSEGQTNCVDLKAMENKAIAQDPFQVSENNPTQTKVPEVIEAPKEHQQQQQQVDPVTCTRKRSKRISDCIAMLTGKLEEKLKTESTVNSKNGEALEADSKVTPSTEKEEKKIPKRKAISRRIIKTNILESNEIRLEQPKEIAKTIATTTIASGKLPIETKSKPIAAPTILTSVAPTTTIPLAAVTLATPPIFSTATITLTKTSLFTAAAATTTIIPAITTTKLTATTTMTAKQITATTTALSTPTITATIAQNASPSSKNSTPKSTKLNILNNNKAISTPSAPKKVILPPPITPHALVSIPIPIASTLHAVPVSLNMLQSHLPVYLPVQQNLNTAMPQLPPAPALPLSIGNSNSVTVSLLPPPPPASTTLLQAHVSPTLPPPTALLQAHTSPSLPPPTTLHQAHPSPTIPPSAAHLQAHASPTLPPPPPPPSYSMEPLNLSNAKGPNKQTTAELRAQRPGIPARRQTICGFEARNLIAHYNEMEPLDLSKKGTEVSSATPNPVLNRNTVLPSLPTVELPKMQSHHQVVAISATGHRLQPSAPPSQCIQLEESAVRPTGLILPTPLPTETLFNKQFYSNLELLKIPQIRSMGFLPPPETILTNNNNNNNNNNNGGNVSNVNLTISPSTNPNPPIVVKPTTNKKRGNTKNSNEQNLLKTPSAVNSLPGANKAKDPTAGNNKKESSAKNKPITKMDEEVINHIDDAINSVINAVKASLPDNDEDDNEKDELKAIKANTKVLAMSTNSSENLIPIPIQPIVEPIAITVNKENSTPPVTKPQFTLTPKKRTLRSKTLDCRSELVAITPPLTRTEILCSPVLLRQKNNFVENFQPSKADVTIEQECKNIEHGKPEPAIEKEEILPTPEKLDKLPEFVATNLMPVEVNSSQSDFQNPKDKENTKEETEKELPNQMSVEPMEMEVINVKETNITPLQVTEENTSNINNTSSGFHSSSTPENGNEVKKKQRRRRKNELAAIVADQLLESFKIDKARRDSLKKLENLAYEKSDDLFVTGMLLMSSTKRNASSNISFTQNSSNERTNEKRTDKKQKQGTTPTPTTQASSKGKGKSNENLTLTQINPIVCTPSTGRGRPSRIVENEITETPFARKGRRRQQPRRKATPLDNENLSKLKTSLESFSIGIEKQLSEIEARSTNILNASENKSKSKNSEAMSGKATAAATSILRPSILSATLEQSDTQKCGGAANAETNNKAAICSRDPRLNKNIHKEGKATVAASTTTTTTMLTTTTESSEKNFVPICDLEDDNYLTEIAKNVNEKIMSAENEDFFENDGFEMANDFQDDSNSKYSRPPTSMSVRSAPNFNDDRSNFGSICDENTNTEVMDMDLDDELSVYTSFSQDLGRGRGRKRRRRRSILLKRKPKKRRSSMDLSTERFECELCKKTFFTANSLSKHNMTLAHVSKVSEREYLLSKAGKTTPPGLEVIDNLKQLTKSPAKKNISNAHENVKSPIKVSPMESGKVLPSLDTAQHLSLNPDERLFFECCNILKSADTPRVARNEYNNENRQTLTYQEYRNQMAANAAAAAAAAAATNNKNPGGEMYRKQATDAKPNYESGTILKAQETFVNPAPIPNNINKMPIINTFAPQERNIHHSPTYSQFSVVTNTTSRFKTKAAMKGYENGNIDLVLPDETKSRTTCKLTELADIALGHDDKQQTTPIVTPKIDEALIGASKRVITPEYVTLSVVDSSRKECNFASIQDKKNNETQGSTSSKTIMHSSIIKAAVEEHGKTTAPPRIIIPERPFKNIGLEEKETITFQKPKTTINLLIDDNSVSTASYSDRDDFDFGSMSCDEEEASNKTSNEKNLKSNSSDSSSSRATAKTFENKSLIMGRIFKNAGNKNKATVKSVGVQKDQVQVPPKADLDQLFDELRGDAAVVKIDAHSRKESTNVNYENTHQNEKIPKEVQNVAAPKKKSQIQTSSTTKTKSNKKSQKDYGKLQSELGMTPEDLEKLIDDGQRKSKRRCAANRSKKLVETWSSDEYEEFLSTKDIIALIEEKEKQEQRKKRKNSVHPTMNSTLLDAREKEKKLHDTTEAIEAPKRNAKLSTTNEKLVGNKQVDVVPLAAKTAATPKENKDKSRYNSEIIEHDKSTTKARQQDDTNKSTSKMSKNKKNNKSIRQTSNRGHKEDITESKMKANKKQIAMEESALQVDDDNLCEIDVKQNNNCTSRTNKTKRDKSAAKESVNSFKSQKREHTHTDLSSSDLKRSNCSTTNTNTNTTANNNNNKKSKSKKKAQTNKSPARKRQGSDKLYYWSSSSDEDFGRINDHEPPEHESSEQFQKHGWIVGDSHKKLVTLLAIAKGNKKVESCGVKKNVSKRKT